jgi:hypothetical protein
VLNGLATAMAAGWQPLIVDWAAHKSYVKM